MFAKRIENLGAAEGTEEDSLRGGGSKRLRGGEKNDDFRTKGSDGRPSPRALPEAEVVVIGGLMDACTAIFCYCQVFAQTRKK